MPDDNFESIQVEAAQKITQKLPYNDYGLPTGYYRIDLLPFHDYDPEAAQLEAPATPEPDHGPQLEYDDGSGEYLPAAPIEDPTEQQIKDSGRIAGFPAKELNNAFVALEYNEGFPAMPDGRPFWGQLEYEPVDAHQAFQQYLQMHKASNPDDPEVPDPKEGMGIRGIAWLIDDLAKTSHHSREILARKVQQWYHLYYWGVRAKAYDLFKVVQYRKQNELRAIQTQDSHYFQARKMMSRLMEYMEDEEEFWDMMTPKTGIDLFKQLVSVERVSAGLPAMGPSSEKSGGAPMYESPETMMQRAGAQANPDVNRDDGDTDAGMIERILSDQSSVESMQEIIIRQWKRGGEEP